MKRVVWRVRQSAQHVDILVAFPTRSCAPAFCRSFQNFDGVFGRNFPSALLTSKSEVVGEVH